MLFLDQVPRYALIEYLGFIFLPLYSETVDIEVVRQVLSNIHDYRVMKTYVSYMYILYLGFIFLPLYSETVDIEVTRQVLSNIHHYRVMKRNV